MQVYEDDFNRTVKVYYDELKHYKPISKAKEKRLIRMAKKGNIKARNELIDSNLRFVFDLAKRYARKGVPITELISEGNLALFKAIDKFDYDKDVKFITYAVWWIRQAMTECIRKNKVKNASEVSNETVSMISITVTSTMYDEEDDFIDVKDSESTYMDDIRLEGEVNQDIAVSNLMCLLNDKERDIIESFYGLNGKEEETLVDIGKRHNLTCERVRQLKNNILRRLKSEALVTYNVEDLFCY